MPLGPGHGCGRTDSPTGRVPVKTCACTDTKRTEKRKTGDERQVQSQAFKSGWKGTLKTTRVPDRLPPSLSPSVFLSLYLNIDRRLCEVAPGHHCQSCNDMSGKRKKKLVHEAINIWKHSTFGSQVEKGGRRSKQEGLRVR